ncbi:MAG: hypothetical protein U5K79_14265 [Cyclobacteriaceae bacterium]|nr:hypothetical protein [Cyclobacteriaceae bacterium]
MKGDRCELARIKYKEFIPKKTARSDECSYNSCVSIDPTILKMIWDFGIQNQNLDDCDIEREPSGLYGYGAFSPVVDYALGMAWSEAAGGVLKTVDSMIPDRKMIPLLNCSKNAVR